MFINNVEHFEYIKKYLYDEGYLDNVKDYVMFHAKISLNEPKM